MRIKFSDKNSFRVDNGYQPLSTRKFFLMTLVS